MAIDENDPRLKDMLKAIELGDLPEDLPLDPEDYDDMGGIKSLDRSAPSIKMASETGPEEFELELMSVINEYNDLKSKGDPAVRDISLDEYINMYLSKKKMMEENRAMAMGGGMMRMGYAGGTDLRNKMSKLMIKVANGTITDKEMIELRNMESAGMSSRANNAYGGRMQYGDGTEPSKMGNPAVMTKIENMREERIMNPDVEDVADYKTYYKNKQDDFPIKKEGKKIDLDIEMIKKLIEKRKKEKKKLAMGGIAGVL